MTTRFLSAFAWICALSNAALAMEPEGRIGDLTYDAKRWEVRESGDGFTVLCRSAHCDAVITARIGADDGSCTAAALEEANRARAYDRGVRIIGRQGFEIFAAVAWTGCRNARPPSVRACTVYKGRLYRFDSPVFGCGGGPGFSDGALDFLEQLGAQ